MAIIEAQIPRTLKPPQKDDMDAFVDSVQLDSRIAKITLPAGRRVQRLPLPPGYFGFGDMQVSRDGTGLYKCTSYVKTIVSTDQFPFMHDLGRERLVIRPYSEHTTQLPEQAKYEAIVLFPGDSDPVLHTLYYYQEGPSPES